MIKSFLLSLFFRTLSATYRCVYLNQKDLKSAPSILAFYHQNLVATITAYGPQHSFAVIVSPSRDGEIIAQILKSLGHQTARGSSSRGGAQGLMNMVRLIKQGHPAAITIDGPRGPLHDIKPGVFQLSKLAGAKIYPVICYPEKYWSFKKSWDQFRLPKPFTRIACVVGEPREISRDDDSSSYKKQSEWLYEALQKSEHIAKDFFNRP